MNTTRRSRNHSLSSIGWRRGPGRGGAFVPTALVCPSPQSSPHSFVAGRGRKSVSPSLCRKCANLHGCSTDKNREVHLWRHARRERKRYLLQTGPNAASAASEICNTMTKVH